MKGEFLLVIVSRATYTCATLPSSLTEKMHVSRMRVYVQGENLFTITPYTGADPEGLGYTYPLPRTFTVGISVGF